MMVMRKRRATFTRRVLQYVVVTVTAFTVCQAASQDWKPSRNVDMVVSSGAGGAADRQARVVQKFLQDEDWKKVQEQNAWGDDFRGSAETRKHLDAEYDMLTGILVDLGVVTK